jgi:uncharacterized membrane protein YhaH (DUF805 family)
VDFSYYLDPITNHYADFQGTASRKAYWMFFLFNFIIQFVGSIVVFGVLGILHLWILGYLVLIAYVLAVFLPSVAIAVRRLHDAGMSGLWLLAGFVPAVGWIIVLVLLCLPPKAPYGVVA